MLHWHSFLRCTLLPSWLVCLGQNNRHVCSGMFVWLFGGVWYMWCVLYMLYMLHIRLFFSLKARSLYSHLTPPHTHYLTHHTHTLFHTPHSLSYTPHMHSLTHTTHALLFRKVLQLLQYICAQSPRDAVASMTSTSLHHVATLIQQSANPPPPSEDAAAVTDIQEMGKAALDLLAQLAAVQELQPRLVCGGSTWLCLLVCTISLHTHHTELPRGARSIASSRSSRV